MFENMTVRDWMSTPVITVGPKTFINTGSQLMQRHNIRRLVVAEGDKLLGIVTKGDIREAKPSDATTLSIWELHYLLAQLTVEKIMTTDVATVTEDQSVGVAAQKMLEQKISGLPVLDNKGKLVGIITESDIFKMVVSQLKVQA